MNKFECENCKGPDQHVTKSGRKLHICIKCEAMFREWYDENPSGIINPDPYRPIFAKPTDDARKEAQKAFDNWKVDGKRSWEGCFVEGFLQGKAILEAAYKLSGELLDRANKRGDDLDNKIKALNIHEPTGDDDWEKYKNENTVYQVALEYKEIIFRDGHAAGQADTEELLELLQQRARVIVHWMEKYNELKPKYDINVAVEQGLKAEVERLEKESVELTNGISKVNEEVANLREALQECLDCVDEGFMINKVLVNKIKALLKQKGGE